MWRALRVIGPDPKPKRYSKTGRTLGTRRPCTGSQYDDQTTNQQ